MGKGGKYNNKVVGKNAQGVEIRPLDVSLTKNAVSILMVSALLIILFLTMNTVTANMNNTSSVSISSKSLQQQYNSVSHPGGYSLIFVLLIPVAVLALGFVIWMKRRKA